MGRSISEVPEKVTDCQQQHCVVLVQEHIRCSLELSCLAQCLDRPQRHAMAQAAIAELIGPITSPAKPPSPLTRSPRAAQGTLSRLKDVVQLCQQTFGLAWEQSDQTLLQQECCLHTGLRLDGDSRILRQLAGLNHQQTLMCSSVLTRLQQTGVDREEDRLTTARHWRGVCESDGRHAARLGQCCRCPCGSPCNCCGGVDLKQCMSSVCQVL